MLVTLFFNDYIHPGLAQMRFLKLNDKDELSLIERNGNSIPEYAILSHTWGLDGEDNL
jgi:hypothetical protein